MSTGAPPIESLQDEIRRLRRAVEELSVLNDLSRAIGASLNSQEIMHTIIHRSLKAVGAEQGVITLVEEEAGLPMRTLVRTAVTSAGQSRYHFNQALLGWMHLNKRPLSIKDPARDDRFRGVTWDESIHSLLSAPMIVKSNLRGVLTVYNKRGRGEFTEEDQRLLAIIASQSAQIVENARLYEAEQSLIQMKEEFRLAARIQADLLPGKPPALPGYDIAGKTIPAKVIGGDYFDFIPLDGDRLAVCLGDVTGKGLTAALLMSNLQATLRGQTLFANSVSGCIERSSRLLYQSTSSDKFATMFYAVLDRSAQTLSYCNAGHDPPFLLRQGGDRLRLEAGGVMMGILEEFTFQQASIALGPGDLLVIYSDGVSEAMDPEFVQFGTDRLTSVIEQCHGSTAQQVIDSIINAVQTHAAGAPQADDITLVVVRGLPA